MPKGMFDMSPSGGGATMLKAVASSRWLDVSRVALALNASNEGPSATTPQQLHLSLAGDTASMTISWVTMVAVAGSMVQWWPAGPQPATPATVTAAQSTYTAGVTGWTGTIYRATMVNLVPGQQFTYRVGTADQWSLPRTFTAANVSVASGTLRLAVTADQGTIQLFGWAVADVIIAEHAARPFDAVILSGDIACT